MAVKRIITSQAALRLAVAEMEIERMHLNNQFPRYVGDIAATDMLGDMVMILDAKISAALQLGKSGRAAR
ncbi:hypothetical protein [Magnetospirillum sp. ME-1]|uniref:hypothetical protein n=1 Tax=Magnetospirillum sp. ME-1 TaxID=1639348 RepID=UPI0011AE56C1|nr:hypothetical protein [Magnetospirillum sp. ME-1]